MLSSVSTNVLAQLKQVIEALQPEQFKQPLAVFNGSSIGAHARHIIEFYECLLCSLETGVVNYDARQRDVQIERNKDYAIQIINNTIAKLLKNNDLEKKIVLRASFGSMNGFEIPTNFMREEAYLIEHNIHHFALIRIGIQEHFPDVCVDKNFGVAHSTVAYRAHEQEINHLPLTINH